MPAECRIVAVENFAAVRGAAPAIDRNDDKAEIFATLAWFENLAATGTDPTATLHLIIAEGGDTHICLPLIDNGKQGIHSLGNYYSCLFAPIGPRQAAGSTIWRAIAEHLRNLRPRRPAIELEPLDAGDPFFHGMIAALRAAGYWTSSYCRFGNWHLDVDGRSFDIYFAGLPSALRHTIERGRKKLDRAGQWQINIHREPGEPLEQAIADYETVYAHSWKPQEGYPSFIRGLCRTAAKQGWLRLGVLHLNGEPAAAQLWLTANGRALIYKLAYDDAFKPLSVGSVLTGAMMRQAIDIDRCHEVDYLQGDEAYKRDWMSHRRERMAIVAWDPLTLRGLLGAARHLAGRVRRTVISRQ